MKSSNEKKPAGYILSMPQHLQEIFWHLYEYLSTTLLKSLKDKTVPWAPCIPSGVGKERKQRLEKDFISKVKLTYI